MSGIDQLKSVDDLLSYSRAIEEESADRYRELSGMMTTYNNPDLAEFFRRMEEIEQKHVDHVKYLQKPGSSARDFHALDLGGREAPDWNEFHYLHLPYHAISIAIRFEERAAAFFAVLASKAEAPDVRQMAAELAEEEKGHVRELTELLKRYPEPAEDWDYDPDPVAEQ